MILITQWVLNGIKERKGDWQRFHFPLLGVIERKSIIKFNVQWIFKRSSMLSISLYSFSVERSCGLKDFSLCKLWRWISQRFITFLMDSWPCLINDMTNSPWQTVYFPSHESDMSVDCRVIKRTLFSASNLFCEKVHQKFIKYCTTSSRWPLGELTIPQTKPSKHIWYPETG